jgi:hypothetical protein
MTTDTEDIAIVAKALAQLTAEVEKMTKTVANLVNKNLQSEALAVEQQERIDKAARELLEVSNRIEVAANALRSQESPGKSSPRP